MMMLRSELSPGSKGALSVLDIHVKATFFSQWLHFPSQIILALPIVITSVSL